MRFTCQFSVRRATLPDIAAIRRLQDAAFRIAVQNDFEANEIASYLHHAGTIEEDVIADGTAFVAESDGAIVASGGWSTRPAAYQRFLTHGALAGGSALVRGPYVDPVYSGMGLEQRLLDVVESDVAAAGHGVACVATTYSQMPFYQGEGFLPVSLLSIALPDGAELHGVMLSKALLSPLAVAA